MENIIICMFAAIKITNAYVHIDDRPMLSNNLYIKGCLDCNVGALHMSIPAEPSLFQDEVQAFNCRAVQVAQ